MANFLIIRSLAERKGLTLRDISAKIGISEGGLQKIIAKGSTNTSTIENIAKVLEVPVGIFFDAHTFPTNQSITSVNGSASSIYGNATVGEKTDKDKEIEHLKELLQEKETIINNKEIIIAEKERLIQMLLNKK